MQNVHATKYWHHDVQIHFNAKRNLRRRSCKFKNMGQKVRSLEEKK